MERPSSVAPRAPQIGEAGGVESRGAPGSWLSPWRFGLFLGVLVFVTFPQVLLGRATFVFRDFGLFSYPVAWFHRESFWRGEIPFWNSFNLCGVPFLAQWNTMVLYPFSALYMVGPLSWSLPLFCLLHLYWGGLGMFLLAQRWTGDRLAAALAGVIFAFNGLALNFLMWPSHVATYAWVPWVIWLAQDGWREGGRKLVWATLAGTMQMLAGGPETIVATWLFLFLLACGDILRRKALGLRTGLRFAGMVGLVALVCSPQLLPFLELLARSQRDSGYSAGTHDWAMPVWGWANFLVPLFRTSPYTQGVFLQNGQYWTSSYYAGVGTILLAAIAFCRSRDWRVRLITVFAFICLVLAWGDASVLFSVIHSLVPTLGFVRYPVKFVIPVLALFPLLAAFGLKILLEGGSRRLPWIVAGLMLGLMGLIVWVEHNPSTPEDVWQATWRNGLSRGLVLVCVMLVLTGVGRLRPAWKSAGAGLLLILFWADLVTHVPNQNPVVSPSVYARGYASAALKREVESPAGAPRLMISPQARAALSGSPGANAEQNLLRQRQAGRPDVNLLDGIAQVDGFFSLVPRECWQINKQLYNTRQQPSAPLLDFLCVSNYVDSANAPAWSPRPGALPLVHAGQQPEFEGSTLSALTNVNLDFTRTVLLPPEARSELAVSGPVGARVMNLRSSNGRLRFEVETPFNTVAVIAQTWYPAWRATLDSRPAKIWRANHAFQAIEIPAGHHEVSLVYRDRAFLAGLVLCVIGLTTCLILWMRNRHEQREAH